MMFLDLWVNLRERLVQDLVLERSEHAEKMSLSAVRTYEILGCWRWTSFCGVIDGRRDGGCAGEVWIVIATSQVLSSGPNLAKSPAKTE